MKISEDEAIKKIKQGEVIALATDTLYGLVAKYDEMSAIEKIFSLKKRPMNKPLIILIDHFNTLSKLAIDLPPFTKELATSFWPGAMTLILPIDVEKVSPLIRANKPTCAFRIPGNLRLLHTLRQTGPLVAPSANLSGSLPATSRDEIESVFGNHFPVLGDATLKDFLPSTLLGYEEDKWMIYREGRIKQNAFEKTLGYVPTIKKEKKSPLFP